MARVALGGVGDRSRGEWIEDRPKAFHLRRCVSAKEEEVVGAIRDLRNTKEGEKRARKAIERGLPRNFVMGEVFQQ